MPKIKIVTESTADIPVALREELGITVLPIPLIAGDKEYRDGYDIEPLEFYKIINESTTLPTHSQITPMAFRELYKQCWKEGYTDLIYISINGKGSATFQNANQAKMMLEEDHPEMASMRIHIVDSKTYTMGYGWAGVEAARMAAKGSSAEEILDMIQDWLDHVRVIFCPLDLRCAKKSGRISAAAAFLGDALGLKPIMTFEDGDSVILAKVRGEKRAISGIMDLVKKERRPGTPFVLIRGENAEAFDALADAIHSQLEQKEEFTYQVGCVIAVNSGPNLIGIVYRT